MIYFFLLLFFIPVYLRFKGSDELFHNKKFGLFLIWFSRLVTFFLMFHVIEHFSGVYAVYALPVFAIYCVHRAIKEKFILTHTRNPNRKEKTVSSTTFSEAV